MRFESSDVVMMLSSVLLIAHLATKSLRYAWGIRLIRPNLLLCAALCVLVIGLLRERDRLFLSLLASACVILFLVEIRDLRKAKRRGWR